MKQLIKFDYNKYMLHIDIYFENTQGIDKKLIIEATNNFFFFERPQY